MAGRFAAGVDRSPETNRDGRGVAVAGLAPGHGNQASGGKRSSGIRLASASVRSWRSPATRPPGGVSLPAQPGGRGRSGAGRVHQGVPAHRAIPGRLPFDVWFSRILVNASLDRLKARARQQRLVAPAVDNQDERSVAHSTGERAVERAPAAGPRAMGPGVAGGGRPSGSTAAGVHAQPGGRADAR